MSFGVKELINSTRNRELSCEERSKLDRDVRRNIRVLILSNPNDRDLC